MKSRLRRSPLAFLFPLSLSACALGVGNRTLPPSPLPPDRILGKQCAIRLIDNPMVLTGVVVRIEKGWIIFKMENTGREVLINPAQVSLIDPFGN